MRNSRPSAIDRLYQKTAEKNIPLNAIFELTHKCNLHCRHCYVVPGEGEELSTEEALNIIDQLEAAGALYLTLTGGEALLRADFFGIARYAKKKQFALRFFTNGTMITAEIADRIMDTGFLDVGISIYGARAETHDWLTRTPGSFEKSVNALRLLKEREVKTILKYLLMDLNIAEMKAVISLSEQLGAFCQFDPIVTPKNNGTRSPLKFQLRKKDLAEILKGDAPLVTGHEEKVDGRHTQDILPALCRAGRDVCSISSNGDVYPCLAFPFPLGNLRRQSFGEIWNSPQARRIRSYSLQDLKKCRNCNIYEHCRICMGLNLVDRGDPLEPSPISCRMAEVLHQNAKVIKE